MINYGKNKNVLAGNFQKTIRFAARLLERLEYISTLHYYKNKRMAKYPKKIVKILIKCATTTTK